MDYSPPRVIAIMASARAEEARIGSRGEERLAVGGVIEAQGGSGRFLVQVVDLSLTGARVRCLSQLLTPGDRLLLDLALAPQRACIVWAEGGTAGCEFVEPLRPLDQRLILKALTGRPVEKSRGFIT